MYKSDDFVVLRSWTIGNDVDVTNDLIKEVFKELITATGYNNLYVHDIEIDKKIPAISLANMDDSRYMGVYVYLNGNTVEMALEGKGHQVKATDLVKLYYKAVGALSSMHAGYTNAKNLAGRFGMRGTSVAVGAGMGVAASAVIGGGVRLVAKGVKVLLRDQEAYDKEMAFYTLALGMGDYLIGGSDPEKINEKLIKNAEENNALAQYILGNAYIEGRGVEVSYEEGIRYFAKAAVNGEKRSREIVAAEYLYSEYEYSIEEKEKGIKYLEEIADGGDEDAAVSLINIYGAGEVKGIAVDADKLVEYAGRYAQRGNIYACMTLANVYDTKKIYSELDVSRYKDDEKAVKKYIQVVNYGDNGYIEEAAMSLADMYAEGRGTEASKEKEIEYYELAAVLGNIEAKAVLAHYYTMGIGTEKNHNNAQSLCDDIIRSGNQEEIPTAYYCSYIIADEAKKYKKSMEYARRYISCVNAEREKKEALEKYLAEQEELISKMSDEERREYLQERKPLFSSFKKKKRDGESFTPLFTNKKTLLTVIGIIIALLAAFFIIKGIGDNGKAEESQSAKTTKVVNMGNDYEVITESEETDIFTDDGTEILVRTVVDIPEVTGNNALNSSVKEWASYYESFAEEFREQHSDFSLVDIEYMDPQHDSEFYGTEYPVYFYLESNIYIPGENDDTFEASRADEKVLSLICSRYISDGGVHGYTASEGVSFDVESGELLSLNMIVDDYDAFSEVVLAYIINSIGGEPELYGWAIDDNYEEMIRLFWDQNETCWYMSDGGLVFFYNQSDLGYAGTVAVEVPYSEVGEYMNVDYVKNAESKSDDSFDESIDQEKEACDYVWQYLCDNNYGVDGVYCEGADEDSFVIRGYDDMGTHITTRFLWTVDSQGNIYDEDGELID